MSPWSAAGLDALGLQLVDQPVRAALGTDEHERQLLARARGARPASSTLLCAETGTKRWSDSVHRLAFGTPPRDARLRWCRRGPAVRPRRRAWPRRTSSDAALGTGGRSVDLWLEAHVEHPVGLVEYQDPDAVADSTALCGSSRSCSRPGVATMMCAFAAPRAWLVDARRRRTRDADPKAASLGDVLDLLCDLLASSLVGTRTSAEAAECRAASRSTIGMANASVLPEPVRDRASTSRPASASRRTRALDCEWGVNASAGQRLMNRRGNAEFGEGGGHVRLLRFRPATSVVAGGARGGRPCPETTGCRIRKEERSEPHGTATPSVLAGYQFRGYGARTISVIIA